MNQFHVFFGKLEQFSFVVQVTGDRLGDEMGCVVDGREPISRKFGVRRFDEFFGLRLEVPRPSSSDEMR